MAIITLLTDFGLKDPYAGVMKGVILGINPAAIVVDITHEIEPQDVREAAFILEESYRFFPPGTVHLCVVDPGVGGDRRAVAAVSAGHLFVGPDNGIFTLVLQDGAEVFGIENPAYRLADISATFHGRDVFAPAAAHLARGVRPADLGPRLSDPVMLTDLQPVIEGDTLQGKVVRFDRFGNAITNVRKEALDAFAGTRPYTVEVAGKRFEAVCRSYFEDTFTLVVGSSGYFEFGCFKGSFRRETGVRKDDEVVIRRA